MWLRRQSRHAGWLTGCAGLALLSACASPAARTASYDATTAYYLAHAAHNYNPPGPPSDPWGPYIHIAATHFDVPETWIRQVMRVESGGHQYIDGQLTVSAAGAMGLMQLEPETYQEMAARYSLGTDAFNPYDNIMAGTAYIHEMYQIYGSPGFLAAYNAGPGRLDQFEHGAQPLPQETRTYVAMIAPNIQGAYPQNRSTADQLALNTLPSYERGGLLPPGFSPNASPPAPTPFTPAPTAAVEVAQLTPAPAPEAPPAQSSALAMNEPNPASIALPSAAPTPQLAAATISQTPIPATTPHTQATQPAPKSNFSIIPAAYAETPIPPRSYTSHSSGWGIQVGAYNSAEKARAALGIAELSAVGSLVNGHALVETIRTDGGTKYRARFTGLPHEKALDACDRLTHGPTGCEILSPDL